MHTSSFRTPFRRSRAVSVGVVTLAIAGATVLACSRSGAPDAPEPTDLSGTFFGPSTTMAGGTVRSYVTLDRAGAPTDLGLALTEGALVDLPATATEWTFVLPAQASATPFKHAVINWQPQGHPPPMIYTVPHFDFHFYSITDAARQAILLGDSALAAKMIRPPSGEFVPVEYVSGMSTVMMGMHWNDPTAPERRGEPFTKTFIYGSYNGVFIFAEPMVTKAFLETKPASVVTPLRLPLQYATTGFHPTTYTVSYDVTAKEYRVSLSGLVRR